MSDFQEDPTIDQPLSDWLDNFDPRMRQEIAFAVEYVERFYHGTSGHLSYK